MLFLGKENWILVSGAQTIESSDNFRRKKCWTNAMLWIIQLSTYIFAGTRTTECTVQHSDWRIVLLWNISVRGPFVCLLAGMCLWVEPISIFFEACLAGSLLCWRTNIFRTWVKIRKGQKKPREVTWLFIGKIINCMSLPRYISAPAYITQFPIIWALN